MNTRSGHDSFISDIITDRWFELPGRIQAAAIMTASKMTQDSEKFFGKVCDEAVSTKSTWISGQHIADAYTPEIDRDPLFESNSGYKSEGKQIEEKVLEMMKKRLIEHGDWLINEIKKADDSMNGCDETENVKEPEKQGKQKGQKKKTPKS